MTKPINTMPRTCTVKKVTTEDVPFFVTSIDLRCRQYPRDGVEFIETAAYDKAIWALRQLVDCMYPHPVEHPSMFKAKKNGHKVLKELGEL